MLRTSRKIDRVAYHQSCKARHVRAMIVIVRWDLPCNLETGIEIGTGWIEGLNWRGGGKGWKRVENNRGYLICRIAAIIVMERVNCENDNHLVSGKTGLEQGERELPFSRDAEKLVETPFYLERENVSSSRRYLIIPTLLIICRVNF